MIQNCFEQFAESVKRYPESAFLHIPRESAKRYSSQAIDYSYQSAFDAVSELIERYQSMGVTASIRVGLMLENRAEFFLHFLALNALGASIVPLHTQYSDEEMRYLVEHSELILFICLAEHQSLVARVCEPIIRDIAVATTKNMASLTIALSTNNTGNESNPDTEAAILYTSGTTGKPKGCVLNNRYFLSWGNWYCGLKGRSELRYGQERLATPLPTNHQNALACSFMGMVASGGCVIQLDRFHSSSWWDTVRESKATIVHYLGVMPAMLLNLPPGAEDDFSQQLRFGLGAGVDPKHHAAFEKRFGFPLVEGWAMTETGGTACIMSNEEPRHVGTRCIGRPPASLDTKLINEQGERVEQGTPGELLVRTVGDDPRKNFFVEYLKDPDATAEAWDGGYFHTGDVVRCDAQGYLYFVDRRKNVIRRSGENIAAVEVEAVLLQQQSVHSCAVTAVDDEFRGEEVVAIVKLNTAYKPAIETAAAIVTEAKAMLAYFKVPGHIVFTESLPVGSTQKVKRGEIKALRDRLLDTDAHFDLCHLKGRYKNNDPSTIS